MRDYDEYGSRPVRIVRKSGFIGKFVSFLLGIIIGIGAFVGGLVGGTYLVGHQVKIKDAMGTVTDMLGADFDYTDYIDESYGEQTLANLVGDVLTAMDDMVNASGTLNTLNNIIPLVGTLVMGDQTGTGDTTSLVAFLEDYGIHIDGTALMGKVVVKPEGAANDPNTYLMDYLMSCVNEITVGDLLLSLDYPLNDILMALFYGVKGEDYDIVNGKPQMKDGKKALTLGGLLSADLESQLYGLPVDALLDINANDPVMAMLVYGKPYRYTLSGGVATMNQITYTGDLATLTFTDMDGKNLTLLAGSEILDGSTGKAKIVLTVNGVEETQYLQYKPTDGLFYAYKSYDETAGTLSNPRKYDKTTIKNLTGNVMDKVMDLTLDDVMDIDPSNKLMSALKDFTIRELPSKVNTLQLKNFITIDPNNKLLSTLGEYNVSELPDKIKQIQLEDIMDIETDPSKPNYNKVLDELNKLTLFDLQPSDIDKIIDTKLYLHDVMNWTNNLLLDYLDTQPIGQIASLLETLTLDKVIIVPKEGETGYSKILSLINEKGPILNLTGDTINDIINNELELRDVLKNIVTDPNAEGYNAVLAKLADKKIGQLSTEINNAINNTKLLEFFPKNTTNRLLLYLGDFTIAQLPGEIDTIPLEKVITDTAGNKILDYLIRKGATVSNVSSVIGNMTVGDALNGNLPEAGEDGYAIMQALAAVKISELSASKINDIIKGLNVEDIITIPEPGEDGYNKILHTFKGTSIEGFAAKVKTLKLRDVVEIQEDDTKEGYNPMLAKLAGLDVATLGTNLPDKILELTLSDVLLDIPTDKSHPDYNHILFLMRGEKLKDLSEKINATPIKQLIPHSDEEKILDHLPETTTLATLSKDLMSLYINDVLEEDIYFCKKVDGNIVWTEKDGNTPLANQTDPAQRVIKPIWWYMLYSNEQYDPTTGTYVTAEYGIHNYPMETGLPRLVGNMQDNIQRVSLQQLSDDGMITLDSDAKNMLKKSIAYNLKVKYGKNTFEIPVVTNDNEKFMREDKTYKEKYGELTMKEFMTYISKVLAIVDPES